MASRLVTETNNLKAWCLSNNRIELLSEWDIDKNSDISPSTVSYASGKKVWWKCSLGHSWESTVGSRTRNKRRCGCPYCSHPPKRVLYGFNDFETWCHNNNADYLLIEWNDEKNKDISPKKITYGCGRRVWWKCGRGHEWCVSPSNRVQGTGCPICSRTQTSFPEQAIAFYLSKTYNIVQRHCIKGFELDIYLLDYAIGIEYDGMHFHTKNKRNKEIEKDTFYEQQGIKLIRIKESENKSGIENNILYYEPRKSNYLDEHFNSMVRSLLSLIGNMTGECQNTDVDVIRDQIEIRAQYASIVKSNSFATVFPELALQWDVEKNHGMRPEDFSAYSQVRVWWRCPKGHSWKAVISSRSRLGCPYCSGQKTISGVSDLESWCLANNQELLQEWDYSKNLLKPSEVSKTSNKKVWWKCAKGHEWEAVIANRVHGTRCPLCFTGKETSRHKTSLAEWCRAYNQMQLISEWHFKKNGSITPENVSKASHKKVWWICSQGHEWEAQIKSRTYNHGCPFCSSTYKKVLVGINDLATWCRKNNKQYILDEWDYDSNQGLTPEMFTFGSHKRIWWHCDKGHKWNAVIKERTKKKGNMCPDCIRPR